MEVIKGTKGREHHRTSSDPMLAKLCCKSIRSAVTGNDDGDRTNALRVNTPLFTGDITGTSRRATHLTEKGK